MVVLLQIDAEDRLEWLQGHILDTLRKTSTFVKKFDEEIANIGSAEAFAEAMGLLSSIA